MAAGMQLTLDRSNIKSMKTAGLSMMPEGLEEGIKPQDLADLMEFIMSGK
jgi:putative heme-binding domain-containing protein